MKASDFNPDYQIQHTESKIVASLERISQAFRVLLWNESKEHTLSPIQIQILIFLFYHGKELCKVSYLADEFNMSKATISDSIKLLFEKKLIKKEYSTEDQRSFIIQLTDKGKEITKTLSGFTSELTKPLKKLSENEKSDLLIQLLNIIRHLQYSGVINPQRMCFTCQHYTCSKQTHYCELLQQELKNSELRIDCEEHVLS